MRENGRREQPQNRTDAKPGLSDVYKKSTRAKRRQADVRLSGRSMVEMLGVLAIIGVLSVGAISGYSKAMEKYKINKFVNSYSILITNLLQYKDSFIHEKNMFDITSTLQKLNLFPEGFIIKNGKVYDSLGFKPYVFIRHERLVTTIILSDTAMKNFRGDLCKEIFLNLLIPHSPNLYYAWVWNDGITDYAWYGDEQCNEKRNCLKNMTLKDIDTTCNSCIEDHPCYIPIEL